MSDRGKSIATAGKAKSQLPEAKYIRELIRRRQMRKRLFGDDLFADPAWDILLDLALARLEHKQVPITSLCIAAGVPTTTALRWIAQMVGVGLLLRIPDPADRRRSYIALADHTADTMTEYFRKSEIKYGPASLKNKMSSDGLLEMLLHRLDRIDGKLGRINT